MNEKYRRFTSVESAKRVALRFGLAFSESSTEWEREAADAARVEEFLEALDDWYMAEGDRFALMGLVLASVAARLGDAPDAPAEAPYLGRLRAELYARPGLHFTWLEEWSEEGRGGGLVTLIRRLRGEVEHELGLGLRRAARGDVEAIVALLADDELGKRRENDVRPLPDSYLSAFKSIEADPAHELMVGEREGEVVATLQLSFLPYLTYQGGTRAQIEAVRVASSLRGTGLGWRLMRWAIERARGRGAHLVQLTTDKARPEALKFYEGLGFRASHEGLKRRLDD